MRSCRTAVLAALAVGAVLAGPARAQQPSPILQQQLAATSASLAPGQRPVTPMYGTYGAHREGVSFLVPLTAGRCYTVVGAGGMGVGDVDMFLFDPANRRVALDRRYDPYTQIFHCAALSGPYRVELKVKRGAGEVAFQVFEQPAAPPQPPQPPIVVGAPPPQQSPILVAPPPPAAPDPMLAPPPAAPHPGDPLTAQLLTAAAALAPGQHLQGAPIGSVTLEGRGHDLYLSLQAGRCYTLITVGAPSIRRIYTYLWEPMTNRRVATDRSATNTSRLMHCAAMSGPYHFQAKAGDGGGEFRTGLFAQ